MGQEMKYAMRKNKNMIKFHDARKDLHWPHIAYSYKCIDCGEAGAIQMPVSNIKNLGGIRKAKSYLLDMLLKDAKLKKTGHNAARHWYCINLDYSKKGITTA